MKQALSVGFGWVGFRVRRLFVVNFVKKLVDALNALEGSVMFKDNIGHELKNKTWGKEAFDKTFSVCEGFHGVAHFGFVLFQQADEDDGMLKILADLDRADSDEAKARIVELQEQNLCNVVADQVLNTFDA